MNRDRRMRLASTAVVVVLALMPVVAMGQQQMPVGPPAGDYHQPASQPWAGQPTLYDSQSTASLADNKNNNDDLAARVKELESALKKIKEKEEQAKAKAASLPTIKVGGRIHIDWANFTQNAASKAQPYGDIENGGEFRRARLAVAGQIFEVVEYKLDVDFAGVQNFAGETAGGEAVFIDDVPQTTFKDVYLGINHLPYLQNVWVGHFKEPFGLEQLMSSNYTTFMERSLPDEGAFVPARNTGIMAWGWAEGEYATWAIGAFKDQNRDNPPFWEDDETATAVTMRMTYLPWFDECTDGRGLIHLGAAYSFRDAQDDRVRFRQRPESHIAPYVVDTGTITGVDNYQLLGLEAAMLYGPLLVQAEYFNTWVDRTIGLQDPRFDGYYAQVSYFLTGENYGYDRRRGIFTGPKPYEPFFRVRDCDGNIHTGLGAWEVAYRFSPIDLVDAGIDGGKGYAHTAGLNWWLNPYTRIMANYVFMEVDRAGLDGEINVFEMRAQVSF